MPIPEQSRFNKAAAITAFSQQLAAGDWQEGTGSRLPAGHSSQRSPAASARQSLRDRRQARAGAPATVCAAAREAGRGAAQRGGGRQQSGNRRAALVPCVRAGAGTGGRTWGALAEDRGTWTCDGPSWEESRLLHLQFHDEVDEGCDEGCGVGGRDQ